MASLSLVRARRPDFHLFNELLIQYRRRRDGVIGQVVPDNTVVLYEGEIDDFARGLAEAVAAHADELDARISSVSGDWPAKQLGTLERNILRIGVHELEEGTVPLEVAIDEAVTLAKRYASEDAGRLVNGILGALAKDAA